MQKSATSFTIVDRIRLFLLLTCILSGVLPATLVQAAVIVYDASGRPTSFDGVEYAGDVYDVSVYWDSSFNLVYGVGGAIVQPKFWGDQAGAGAAILVLKDALIADSFSPIAGTSYLTNPFTSVAGIGIYLHRADYFLNQINYIPSGIYSTLGLTVWNQRGPYTVTPSAGVNGSITPAGPQTVDHLSTTQFTCDADSNYHVASISGCGINYVNTDHGVTSRTETTGAITEDCPVSATFASNTYQLSVTTEGKGTGSVTSDLGNIDCPGTCSEQFNYGTILTLTAVPENGSSFAGWSGDCTGTDLTCDVTVDQTRSVTADFYYFPWTMFLPAKTK